MTITNDQRASWAKHGLVSYATCKEGGGELYDTPELVISDFLTDLMHHAGQENIDFAACLDRAEAHYQEECAEETPQRYIEVLEHIAAIPLWGETIKDLKLLREYLVIGEYNEDGFAPSVDTESNLLQDAVEIARRVLGKERRS